MPRKLPPKRRPPPPPPPPAVTGKQLSIMPGHLTPKTTHILQGQSITAAPTPGMLQVLSSPPPPPPGGESEAWTEVTPTSGTVLTDENGVTWGFNSSHVVLRNGVTVVWAGQLMTCNWPKLYVLSDGGTWYDCDRSTMVATPISDPRPASPPPPPPPPPPPGGDVLSVSRDAANNMDPFSGSMMWYGMYRTNNGRIVTAAGGFHSPGSSRNSIREYNPATRTWRSCKVDDSYSGTNYYAATTTNWVSTDNVINLFIPSLGGGCYVSPQVIYDVGNNAFLASNITEASSQDPDCQAGNPAPYYLDFPNGTPQLKVREFIHYDEQHWTAIPQYDWPAGHGDGSQAGIWDGNRSFEGWNSACLWNDAVNVGISTPPTVGGNSGNGDNRWFWIEYNPTYDPGQPIGYNNPRMRTRWFTPPSLFLSPTFWGATGGNREWILTRNFCQMVGEDFYVGGGYVAAASGTVELRYRINRRFFKINIRLLYAATTDAEKMAAVTELAPTPGTALAWGDGTCYANRDNGVGAAYPALSYDEARRKFLLFSDDKIWCYDIASDAWSNVTPTGSQLGTLANGWAGWTSTPLEGWMAVYDPATDAHYVREGSYYLDDPDCAEYARLNQDAYAGRMRKVQFVDSPPSRWSTVTHGGGTPFNILYNGSKHLALTYDEVADELIQGGGDFPTSFYFPFSPLHPTNNPLDPWVNYSIDPGTVYASEAYSAWPSSPIQWHWDSSAKKFHYASAGGKRDLWMCKPKHDIALNGVLNWVCVQPPCMPYLSGDGVTPNDQGPAYPDQTWWYQRTAVAPREWYLIPGAYRPEQYYVDYGMMPEFGGTPSTLHPTIPDNSGMPYQWLRAGGWKRITGARRMVKWPVSDPVTQFAVVTNFGDGAKFCAYDKKTDTAYSINDSFEIVKFVHSGTSGDYTRVPLGDPLADDAGYVFPLDGNRSIQCGGSVQAIVDRRVYALGLWFYHTNGLTKSYLAWYDIDANTRGLIPCPFDIDTSWTENSGKEWTSAPEETSGLVACNRKLVVARTRNLPNANTPMLWIYDVDTKRWTTGESPTTDKWGNQWVALPFMNSVMFFGIVDDPQNRDSSPLVHLYRIR